jgi:CheY-like chemotaxis protein
MRGRERILVLDIDEQLLVELEGLLENQGFETTTTWEYREALQLLQSHEFDFVLVGDHPPDIDPSELLKQLHAMQSSPPCIVLRSPNLEPTLRVPGVLAVVDRHSPSDILRVIKERVELRQRFTAA